MIFILLTAKLCISTVVVLQVKYYNALLALMDHTALQYCCRGGEQPLGCCFSRMLSAFLGTGGYFWVGRCVTVKLGWWMSQPREQSHGAERSMREVSWISLSLSLCMRCKWKCLEKLFMLYQECFDFGEGALFVRQWSVSMPACVLCSRQVAKLVWSLGKSY